MARTNTENLAVYRLAEDLADSAWEIVNTWERLPRTTVRCQLIGAADSIGANITEGSGRGSFQDNRRFVKITCVSLCETKHWLRRADKRRQLAAEHIDRFKCLVDELGPDLTPTSSPSTKPLKQQTTDHGLLTN